MPLGNLLVPAAIILSGNTFAPINYFVSCLNLQIMSKTTFYKIQDKYVIPVVNNSWHKHQNSVLKETKNQKNSLNVGEDGRCDSPRHLAKYGTYSLLDESSGKVVEFSFMQVTEVSSSNAMEYEGCKRSLDKLIKKKIPVRCLTTDRLLLSLQKWSVATCDGDVSVMKEKWVSIVHHASDKHS